MSYSSLSRRPGGRLAVAAGLLAAGLTSPVLAADTPSPWRIDARYRFEHVDDDGFARTANAHTLRLRLGYLFAPTFAPGWSVYLEGEHVEAIGDGFNSTANGRLDRPVVADPEDSELNQAWLGYRNDRFEARLGRQRITLDNHRFVGNVGWRQNEQTFDGGWLALTPATGWRLQYGYLASVQRVFGDTAINPLLGEREVDSHLFDVEYAPGGRWKLGSLLLAHEDRDVPTDSHLTWALRWLDQRSLTEGVGLGWRAEYARQWDMGNQPARFGVDYWRVGPSLTWQGITFNAGWERLDGDGRRGFQTPLATLHAFNGWADRFLATPANGLDDRFIGLAGTLGKAKWGLTWHDFDAARHNADYGSEWDASLGYPLPFGLSALVKLARYDSDGFSADVTKFWLQLEYRR